MTLSYFFSDARFEDLFLPELTKAAEKRQHPLVIGTALEADVHFLHAACSVSKRLGFRLAVGDGWSEELEKQHEIQFHLKDAALTAQEAQMLVNWIFDRKELKKVSPLRHDLGNLVVILLGRVMRMKLEATTEHTESLENLHRRMGELYQKFDDLKIPRP